MALSGSVTGDGILVSTSTDYNKWVEGTEVRVEVQEITTEEVREWVALTKTAAETTAKAADQLGLAAGAVASYIASEDNRVVGSYKLTKTITNKTVSVVT
jgi:hypothetical protein